MSAELDVVEEHARAALQRAARARGVRERIQAHAELGAVVRLLADLARRAELRRAAGEELQRRAAARGGK